MTIQELAEKAVDQLQDDRLSLSEFVKVLVNEAAFQAKRAAKEADDYTPEELDFWSEVGTDARRLDGTVQHSRDLLYAIDRGYFGSIEEIKTSAFLEPLREALR